MRPTVPLGGSGDLADERDRLLLALLETLGRERGRGGA